MTRHRRPWSGEDVSQLIYLRDVDGRKLRDIAATLGRSIAACATEYRKQKKSAGLPAPEKISKGADAPSLRVIVPPEVIAARAQRQAAMDQRNLTAVFFGDPAPGYRALDMACR